MHILIASFQARYSDDAFSGVDGQNESMRGLLDILVDKHQIDIWTPRPGIPQWKGVLEKEKLISKIRKVKPDLVHLILPTPNFYFMAEQIDEKVTPPVIVRYNSTVIQRTPPIPHNFSDLRWVAEKTLVNNGLNGKFLSIIAPPSRNRTTLVSSEFQKRGLIDGIDLTRSQIKVIPNNSRMSFYEESIRSKETSKVSQEPTLGYIGHNTLAKGVEELLEAFIKLERDSNLVLALSGHGKDIHNIKRYQKHDNIHIHGVVDKKWFFERIDAVVLPYRFSYGTQIFPNTLLEAIYSGIPVITSRLPYMKEILTEQENALLFEPGNSEALYEAIRRFCLDQSLQDKISGSKIPDKLNPMKIKKNLEEIYRKVI